MASCSCDRIKDPPCWTHQHETMMSLSLSEATHFLLPDQLMCLCVCVCVCVCVSQVCVEFSARGYDIRYWSGPVLISVCVSVCECVCVSRLSSLVLSRQTACVFTVNTVASVWSALGSDALWLCFHCLLCMRYLRKWLAATATAELSSQTEQILLLEILSES